jgi:hypothetical protein
MYNEPRPMKEIHDIQARLYDKEKDLSNKELIAKIRREAIEAKEKYGLKFCKHAHTH